MTQITKIVWNGCDSYEIGNESVFTPRGDLRCFKEI